MKTPITYLLGISLLFFANQLNAQTWSAVGGSVNTGTITYCLTADNTNNFIYLGGTFTKMGGGAGTSANNIARWNGSSWAALGTGMDNSVFALTMWGGNLYAGGGFSTAGGVAANNIAKWNGASWSALSVGTDMTVYSLCVYNGDLYAGGSFNNAGGVANTRGIAKWNGSAWSAVASGYPNGTTINSMCVYNGELYIGHTTFAAFSLDKWDGATLSTVTTVNNSIMGFAVNTTTNTLYEGGWYYSPNPNYVSQGTAVTAVGSSGMNDGVRALTIYNNQLYAGGRFTTSDGVTTNYVASWNGSAWSPVSNGMNQQIYSFAILNGVLYAAGFFTKVNGASTTANLVAQITIVLPVQLVAFSGKNADGVNKIEWAAATEKNNDYFTVEKSADGKSFYELGKVDGAGNSTTLKNYSFIDEHPLPGNSYYQLKQTDYSGEYNYSNIIVVKKNEDNKPSFLTVYPNPSKGLVTFSGKMQNTSGKEVTIAISDITGRKIYSEMTPLLSDGTFSITLNSTDKLTPGTYLVTANTESEVQEQRLVIK